MPVDVTQSLMPKLLTPQLWCALVLILLAAGLLRGVDGYHIETDILALLPATEQDPVIEHASARFNDNLSRRHLLLVGDSDLTTAVAGADRLVSQLAGVPGIAQITYRLDEQRQRQSIAVYLPYKQQLLDAATRSLLERGGAQALLTESLQMIYSPMTPLSSALLGSDPLLLNYRFLTSMSAQLSSVTLQQGLLVSKYKGRHYVLINLHLDDSPFSIHLQQQLLPALNKTIDQIRQAHPTVEVVNVGVARFAAAGVRSAWREISTIGTGSLLAVVLILWLVFRSPLPLLTSLLPIAIGFSAAFVSCQWVFGSVHLLTLVFGASLIGISIDYSFHYFTDRLAGDKNWDSKAGLQRILPGISLGLVTSVIAYAGLCFAPFPGMQQMALFSSVGLVAAFLTVVCLFPVLASQGCDNDGRWLKRAERVLQFLQWKKTNVAMLVSALLVVVISGLIQLTANDDIRLLQSSPIELKQQEQQAMAILGTGLSHQFLLVEGDSAQQVLEKEESLHADLLALQQQGKLQRFDAISRQLPSRARQSKDHKLLQQSLLSAPQPLTAYGESLGMSASLLNNWSQQLAEPLSDYLELSSWLASPAGEPLRHLWLGKTERGYASVITLYRADYNAVKALEQPQLSVVDKTRDISNLFGDYRTKAALLVVFSYLVIYTVLMFRYRWHGALWLMLPPALSVLLVLALLGWTQQPMNLFHLLALLLVLGVGVDYTLFLEEGKQHRSSTLLAIILSAITSLLSFGLLAMSNTPAVQAFGFTVLIGVGSCVLLAPLLCRRFDDK